MDAFLIIILSLIILYVIGSVVILVCIWWTHKYK